MSRSATRALVLVALAVGSAFSGCGEDGGGDAATPEPVAEDERPLIPTSEPASTPTATPEPTPDASEAATASLDPCELLTSSEQRQLGVEPQGPKEVGYARSCEWKASGRFSLAVAVFDTIGARDLVSKSKPRDLRIGSHSARQGTGGLSACVFAIGVSETSRVDVVSSANGVVRRACGVAKRAAAMVEPKLP